MNLSDKLEIMKAMVECEMHPEIIIDTLRYIEMDDNLPYALRRAYENLEAITKDEEENEEEENSNNLWNSASDLKSAEDKFKKIQYLGRNVSEKYYKLFDYTQIMNLSMSESREWIFVALPS